MRRALVALVLLAACGEPVDTSWHQEQGHRWRALDVSGGSDDAGFTALRAAKTGLAHRNDIDEEHALANRNLLIGAGVAIGDVDEDGLPDLFLASVERPPALYRNRGEMRFEDVTAASGIDAARLSTLSAAFADVNGDAHLDLLVGTLGGPVKLWLGDGKARFRDASAGLPTTGYASTALTLADVDGDGDLDLYVGTYKTRNALDAYPPQARSFEQVVRKVGNEYRVLPQWEKEYRLEDRPDLGGIMRSQRAEPDLFFVNDGRGRFAEEPVAGPRWRDEKGRPVPAPPDFFTLAARFYDVNGDGAPDLYACNDFEDPDQFWLGDGRGGFRLAPALALRESSNTCMSVDFGDVNRDGHVDFFTADMMSPALARRQVQFPTNTPLPKPVGLPDERQQWMRNMLQVARGDGTWADVSMFAGVEASEWTWGSAFVDVDLDGWEDLLAVNGHRWDVRDAGTFERIRNSFPRVAWNREQQEFPRHDARSVAWRNRGDLTFSDERERWGFGRDSAITNGLALGDLDGDGDLDAVATRLGDAPVVYRSESRAPRVAVRLRGAGGNRYGVGATVTVRARGLPEQRRQLMPTGYYLSSSDPVLSFAAGPDSVVELEVRWPDGRASVLRAGANRLYEVDQASAAAPRPASPPPPALFEDATALLGGHAHADALYEDERRQPLIPNRLSQLGPGVSWIDVDADGRDDLVVGAGRGGRLAVLRNAGGRFAAAAPGEPARWDLTTIVPVPQAGGRVGLAVGQSSYEADSAAEALGVPGVVVRAPGGGAATVLAPGDTASVGPLALGDVDGDGLLDLFVGARVKPGAWPLAARSRLYRRQPDGGWAPDAVNAEAVARLGLVSAALWTDLDGDGRPELVVTSEWGPVRVLRNEGGRLRDATREWELSGASSRWNGLAVGDWDGDGRMDLVVTSWGRNTPWRASPDQPWTLVLGEFGGDGMGLVFARADSLTGREMPQESWARLGVAIPAVKSRFASFDAFARASVDELLGDAARGARRVGATTFEHRLLLNRGGRFEVRTLPAAAQLAPAFGAVVADWDGDGREDLFLAQNFSPTAIETPRFDAGAGLVLLGDGRGGFRPLAVPAAGIAVPGDGRGAATADFDGDARPDLAVSQNGARTTLWRNRGARPGVRVRLDAGAGNPWAIGARLQVRAGGKLGPARELHAGAGYWSVDAPTTVLALPEGADALVVTWPGGARQEVPLVAGQREVVVRRASGS